jgi:hypothetical protein
MLHRSCWRALLPITAIGLVALLGGCVVYPSYPTYPAYSYGYGPAAPPYYGGGAYVGLGGGGGWHHRYWHDRW